MQPGADRQPPSPSSMPRRRSVPPAPVQRPRGLNFSRSVPHRGRLEAFYIFDTGVLCSIARDEVGCHQFVKHFEGRMYTTDVIVDEVKNRASRPIGPDGQLMKLAAADALRRLILPGKVQIVSLDAAAWTTYDSVMQQLRGLTAARAADVDELNVVERHSGEASAIAWSKQSLAADYQVVLVTNDGDASVAAASQSVEVRHFGHVLHELVCANRLASDKAWNFYERAVGMSGIPTPAALRSKDDLVCKGTAERCTACEFSSGL